MKKIMAVLTILILSTVGCGSPCYEVCDYLFAKAESCFSDIPGRQGTINNTVNREVCARFFGAVNEIVKGKGAECVGLLGEPDDIDCTNVLPLINELFPDGNSDSNTEGA